MMPSGVQSALQIFVAFLRSRIRCRLVPQLSSWKATRFGATCVAARLARIGKTRVDYACSAWYSMPQ